MINVKLTGFEDLRVQRTIKSIYQAFEELICEKPYNKITVTELARRAQINKKTFYRYYETLDDLLAELQARYSQEYLDEVKGLQYPRDLDKSIELFFTYSAKQGEAYDKITTNLSYNGIRGQMVNHVMKKTWGQSAAFQRLSSWEQDILLRFIEQNGLMIYQHWVEGGRKQPLDQIIEEAQRLTLGGVEAYLKN